MKLKLYLITLILYTGMRWLWFILAEILWWSVTVATTSAITVWVGKRMKG